MPFKKSQSQTDIHFRLFVNGVPLIDSLSVRLAGIIIYAVYWLRFILSNEPTDTQQCISILFLNNSNSKISWLIVLFSVKSMNRIDFFFAENFRLTATNSHWITKIFLNPWIMCMNNSRIWLIYDNWKYESWLSLLWWFFWLVIQGKISISLELFTNAMERQGEAWKYS